LAFITDIDRKKLLAIGNGPGQINNGNQSVTVGFNKTKKAA